MISIIIPIRNKEKGRLQKVISRLKSDIISEIIIVDYYSDKKFKLDGKKVKVIRYNKKGPWNKAHAINIGLKNSKSDYIMTIDADILVENGFADKLVLDENTYCYSGNVRRIEMKYVSSVFKDMLKKSTPWKQITPYSQAMYGLANGGLQLYHRSLLEKWNGIDENLVYSGGMDNITNLMAKKLGMKITQLPIKLLHIEHKNQKADNYPEDERLLARYLQSKRGYYLNKWVENPVINNFYGMDGGPCYSTYLEDLSLFKENKEEIKKAYRKLELRESKIMIAIINNTGTLPDRFVKSLINLFNTTCLQFPNTELKFVKACQVNHMRNISVNRAIEEESDYLIQLDTDHIYDADTIIKLIEHDKDFVCVPTKQRVSPFMPTQYLKFKTPIKQKGNCVFVKNKPGLIKIEVSGPVAMLMKVSALKEMDFPHYYMDYSYGFEDTMGGDYVFCRQLKEKGFEIYLDPTIDCPHFVHCSIGSHGSEAEIDLDSGRM